jgi:hypothetical protein
MALGGITLLLFALVMVRGSEPSEDTVRAGATARMVTNSPRVASAGETRDEPQVTATPDAPGPNDFEIPDDDAPAPARPVVNAKRGKAASHGPIVRNTPY